MKLLGEYLRELNDLSSDDLVEALRYQVGLRDKGQQSQLGMVLVSLGLATEDDVLTALELQSQDRETAPQAGSFTVQPASLWISRG